MILVTFLFLVCSLFLSFCKEGLSFVSHQSIPLFTSKIRSVIQRMNEWRDAISVPTDDDVSRDNISQYEHE